MALSLKPVFETIELGHKICDRDGRSCPSFVLLVCDHHATDSVMEKICSLSTVTSVRKVEGLYDLLVVIRSESTQRIKQTIADKIRTIDGVRTCLTLFGLDPTGSWKK